MHLNTHKYPKNFENPSHLVIMLHGYGSNGQDLLSLAPELQTALPNALFLSPDAIHKFEGGIEGSFQWYSLFDRSDKKMLEGAKKAFPVIDAFINEQLRKYNLTHDKLFLMGFSQGGMLTMYLAYRMKKKIAGAISFSGFMVLSDNIENEIQNRPPILITHGIEDTVVPVQAAEYAGKKLQSLNIDVTVTKIPKLAHGIDLQAIQDANKFLIKNS